MNIAKSAAVAKAGTAAALAAILDVSPQAVSQWGKYLPPLQAYRLKERRPRWMAELVQKVGRK